MVGHQVVSEAGFFARKNFSSPEKEKRKERLSTSCSRKTDSLAIKNTLTTMTILEGNQLLCLDLHSFLSIHHDRGALD